MTLYIAMPPLYKVMPKKGQEEYLYDDKALERYRRAHKPGSFTPVSYTHLAYLNPELTIRFEDKRGAEVEDITYHEPDGIIAVSYTHLLCPFQRTGLFHSIWYRISHWKSYSHRRKYHR